MSPKEVARTSKGDAARVDVNNVQALDLDEIQHEEQPMLVARGAAYAREYHRIEQHPTMLLQNIATVIVAIRLKYNDLRGEGYEYRQTVAEMYRAAGIPTDAAGRVQASVRYHVGNALRRHLTPRELKSVRLLPESPLERLQDQRATNAVILKASRVSVELEASTAARTKQKTKKAPKGQVIEEKVPAQGGRSPVAATADHLRLASVALGIVGQMKTDVIDDDMTDGQRAKLDEHLAAMQAAITKLRRHSRRRTSDGK
ncbi:hypothetical protein [Streptomyces umbrinus]|uniref:hypothetical protein n=1 Tax=Streptomyces umbrinus TaxID=67370 RepID=UPI00342C9395